MIGIAAGGPVIPNFGGGSASFACERANRLQGPAAAAARRDCGRMPTSGTCFSPDDAQADRPGRSDLDRAADPSDRKRR